ncbi:hypothetical protein L195_g054582 [Trifolium pratense]|uniref:Uncharacterized protein n=1 Tax=Trifolium pratense TaxID=57577 RepID=A0A2K3KGW9_TRIPR|nr:hypothetical protein L195_g054582 [Trifolium pratense]
MVPKEPTASVYTMRKRKSKRKAETQEEQVKPDLLTQKKIKMEQAAELRTKHKHEAPAERVVEESSRAPKRKMQLDDDADSEGTDSDEQTLASRLQQKQAPAPKGKALKISSETDKELGYSKPLRSTIHPDPINISSSDNSEELSCSTDELLRRGKKGLSKHTSSDKS